MKKNNNESNRTKTAMQASNELSSATEITPDLVTLKAYTQVKLTLASQLRIIREAFAALGRETEERQCGELIVKLAEDRFTLAVLGQFKRGKSSLMNAIIGRELLPTGVLPLTSAITILKYGPKERLVVQRENWGFPDELPLTALADYVTEKGNPSNTKRIKTASVELPIPFLRRGVEFVDTPGVGSTISANTDTTYNFLPACDAVLFVTSVDTPMTSLELAFLNDIREYVHKIFFVINKTDLVPPSEQAEVLEFVKETIRKCTGHNHAKVFPISARNGLAARLVGDAALYEQSGLKMLEEALASFLSEEKSTTFLTAITHKALHILEGSAFKNPLEKRSLPLTPPVITSASKNSAALRNPQSVVAAVIQAQNKLQTLYEFLKDGQLNTSVENDTFFFETIKTALPIREQIKESAPSDIDLAKELQTRGCPICWHLAKQTWDFFSRWQYHLGTEEQAQIQFAAELGFCSLHTWQLLSLSSPHGASVGYARLADYIAKRLKESTDIATGPETVRRLVSASHQCRVCEMQQQTEKKYILQLAQVIDEGSGKGEYLQSQGVCLRHLDLLLTAVVTVDSRKFLLSHAAQRFEEDAEDMQSFAMKHEAIRRSLQNRNEEDAYRRTITRIFGDKKVCMPWPEDGEI